MQFLFMASIQSDISLSGFIQIYSLRKGSGGNAANRKLLYLRSINPMIEKINPAIPIPIESSSIPDEQREITIAKSNIAIPNPIFFIVNPPLQIPIVI